MYLNTFANIPFYIIIKISSLFIQSIINLKIERNIRHKISSIIQYVNNITDMHENLKIVKICNY